MNANVAHASLSAALLFLLAACASREEVTSPDGNGENPPIDVATATIEPTGGTVALEDGTAVVFPPGAVTSPLEVTLEKLEPSTWFADTGDEGRTVVRTTAETTEFARDVEIRFPLPEGVTVDDSAAVLAGVIDESSGAVSIERTDIRMIDGNPFAVVETNHFSSRLCEWIFGADPPPSALLSVPYFNQGSSPFCWAVTVQTVTQAVVHEDLRSTMEIIGAVGIDEEGITAASYRVNSDIANIVRQRTGVNPTRMMWDFVNRNQMRDYLWREIGLKGHPVGVFSSRWEHAVTVVGYDGATFKVHDPNSVTTSSIGYTDKGWSEFIDGMAFNDKLVTLVVPKDLPQFNDRVTASWLTQAFELTQPGYGPDEPSAIWRYQWDHREPEGYTIRHASTEEVGDPLPGEVAFLRVNGDLQLANSSRTASQEMGVFVDITAMDAPEGVGRHSTYRTVTVAPNSIHNIHVPDLEVDNFRYNTDHDVKYLLSAIVRTGGETVDWQTIRFRIAPVVPELTSITPAVAAIGDQVTVEGKKLGLLATNNRVLFNGVEAPAVVSWGDTEVVVVVPEGATTGPVRLERGEVGSNTVEFAISELTTLSGAVDASYGDEVVTGATIQVAGTWTLRAPGAALDYYVPETRHYSWYVEKDAPGELALSFSGTISPSEVPIDGGGKIVFLPLEWEYTTSASGSDFSWSESAADGDNDLGFTLETYDDMLCSNPYFGVYGDVYDEDGNLTQSHVFLNGRTVGVFCVKP